MIRKFKDTLSPAAGAVCWWLLDRFPFTLGVLAGTVIILAVSFVLQVFLPD